jgi:hypothetical protein
MSGEDAPRPYLESLIVPELIKTNKQTINKAHSLRVASGWEGARHTSIKTRSRTRGARLLDRARVTVVKSGSGRHRKPLSSKVGVLRVLRSSQDSSHCNFSGVHHLSQTYGVHRHVPVPGISRPWGLRAGVTAGGLVHLSDKCACTIKCESLRGVRAKLVTAL